MNHEIELKREVSKARRLRNDNKLQQGLEDKNKFKDYWK